MPLAIILVVFLGIVYFIMSDRENGYKHFSWLLGNKGDVLASEIFYFKDGLDIAAGSPCKIIVTKEQLLFKVMENTYKIGKAQLKGAYAFGENSIIEKGSHDGAGENQLGIDFKHLSRVVCNLNGEGIKKAVAEKYYLIISYISSSEGLKTIMFAPVKEGNISIGPLFAFAGKINKTYELNVNKVTSEQKPSDDDFIQL